MKDNFTSFELMKEFNISRGSWSSIKNKFNLNEYAIKTFEGKKEKYIYNRQAYDILNNYFNFKDSSSEYKNSLLLINIQSKEIEELKNLSTTFQRYYEEEKEKKEDLLILTEDLKNNISNLEKDKSLLELEIERLKNRSFFDRLFNRF